MPLLVVDSVSIVGRCEGVFYINGEGSCNGGGGGSDGRMRHCSSSALPPGGLLWWGLHLGQHGGIIGGSVAGGDLDVFGGSVGVASDALFADNLFIVVDFMF